MRQILKVALFVEGSRGERDRSGSPFLDRIWNEIIVETLGLEPFHRVIPINKKHLVAMDPASPPMSGSAEPLDAYMRRECDRGPFDAAVVAWDLHPRWNPRGEYCRWEETKDLYRHLAASAHLPEHWKRYAKDRFDDLSARPRPSVRSAVPELVPGAVLPVCMVSTFESVLVVSEQGIRSALGVAGRNVPGWPRSWRSASCRDPGSELLKPAIDAAGRHRPLPRIFRRMHGTMSDAKNEWGHFLLGSLLANGDCAEEVRHHAVLRRIAEVCPRRGQRDLRLSPPGRAPGRRR